MTTFITLDRVLGEDTVQRWLGGVSTSVEPLEKGAPFATLIEAVGAAVPRRDRRALHHPARGGPRRPADVRDDQPRAQADRPPRLRHPCLRRRRAPRIREPEGMPTDDDADALSDIEDELEEMITGDAVYFGRETVHGRRALHWFVAADHRSPRRAAQPGPRATPTATSASPGPPTPAGPPPIASADARPAPWDGTSRLLRLLPMYATARCAGTSARAVKLSSAAGHFARVAGLASSRASSGAFSPPSERPRRGRFRGGITFTRADHPALPASRALRREVGERGGDWPPRPGPRRSVAVRADLGSCHGRARRQIPVAALTLGYSSVDDS